MPKTDTKNEILDSLSEGVYTIDRDFHITFLNRAAEEILGFSRQEVTGKKCMHVCKSEFCADECPVALVLKTGRNLFDFNSRLRAVDGRYIPIRLNAAVLRNEQNRPIGAVISFRDISNQKISTSSQEKNKHFHGMIGRSTEMKELFDLILEIADSDAPVLIEGETGTGKELVANAIQETSHRCKMPFVKVNCSVIPPHLLASELFGHVKGAFTDARSNRTGRFELADNGTIFLDEIAEIPLQMQPQLLRVIQDGTFERLGESTTNKVNVRIIAATNRDLPAAIAEGKFREDLYYRLNVIPVKVPPLRERISDLPYLVQYFIEKYSPLYKKNFNDIDDEALEILMNHDWKGNVRELENAIEYAIIRSRKNTTICRCGLPPHIRKNINCPKQKSRVNLAQIESGELIKLLERHNWNQSLVAETLGVNRTTIWRRLKAMGIQK